MQNDHDSTLEAKTQEVYTKRTPAEFRTLVEQLRALVDSQELQTRCIQLCLEQVRTWIGGGQGEGTLFEYVAIEAVEFRLVHQFLHINPPGSRTPSILTRMMVLAAVSHEECGRSFQTKELAGFYELSTWLDGTNYWGQLEIPGSDGGTQVIGTKFNAV